MAQDSKRGLFNSVFGSKKKTEEELEAEQQSRQRIENRIREVLTVTDRPSLEPASEFKLEAQDSQQTQPAAIPGLPAEEPEFTYLHPSALPQGSRKSPSRYTPAFQTLEPVQASQAR